MKTTKLLSPQEGLPFTAFVEGTMDASSFVRWLTGHKSMESGKFLYSHTVAIEKIKDATARTQDYTSRFLMFMDHVEQYPEVGKKLCNTIVQELPQTYHGLCALFTQDPSQTPPEQWERLLTIEHLYGFLRNAVFCRYPSAYLMHHVATRADKKIGRETMTHLLEYTYFSLDIKSHVRQISHYAENKSTISRYPDVFRYSLPYLEKTLLAQRGSSDKFELVSMANLYESVFCIISRYALITHDAIVAYRKDSPWTGSGRDPLLQFWAYGYFKDPFHNSVECSQFQSFHFTSIFLDHIDPQDMELVCQKVVLNQHVKVPSLLWGHVVRWMLERDYPLNLEAEKSTSIVAHHVLTQDSLRLVLREMVFHPESRVWNFPWTTAFRHSQFEYTVKNHLGFFFEGNKLSSVEASRGIRQLLEHPDWLMVWTWDLWKNRDTIDRSMLLRLLKRTGESDEVMQQPLAFLGNQSMVQVLQRMQMLDELNPRLLAPNWKDFYVGWSLLQAYLYAPTVAVDPSFDASGVV